MGDRNKKPKKKKQPSLAEFFGVRDEDNLLNMAFEFDEKEGLDVIDTKKLKKKVNNDKQYKSLLSEAKRQPRGVGGREDPLDEDLKYKGKKIKRKELEDFDDDGEIEIKSEDSETDAKMHQEWLGASGKRKKQKIGGESQYLVDELNVDKFLEKIEEEDKRNTTKDSKEIEDERRKSKAVAMQLKTWKSLLLIRYFLQKPLETAKKLPLNVDFPFFLNKKVSGEATSTLRGGLKFLEVNTVDLIEKLILIQNKCSPPLQKASTPLLKTIAQDINKSNINKNAFLNKYEVNTDDLWKLMEENFNGHYPWVEESLNKWSQKTNILSSNLRRSGLHNLMQTPIGQTQKAMEQADKLVLKSQLKRGQFRILGLPEDDVHCNYNEQIYDDADFFQELLKDFTEDANNLENAEVFGPEGDLLGNDFLVDSTKRYLQERKLKEEEKIKKAVDRKASKNRKLRYDVHPKLINFMAPSDNIYIMEGRDEIIKTIKDSLSGKIEKQGKTIEEAPKESLKNKGLNKTKRQRSASQDMDIQLI